MNSRWNVHAGAKQVGAIFLSALMAAGCGSSVGAGGGGTDTNGAARIAGGAETGGSVQPAPEAPPYHFEPVSHAPIYRNTETPVPALNGFPALEMRFAQCFGREETRPIPIATSPSGASSGAKPPKRSGNTSTSSGGRRAKSKPSSSGAGSGMATGAGSAVSGALSDGLAPTYAQPAKSVDKKKDAVGRKESAASAKSESVQASQPAMSSPPPTASYEAAAPMEEADMAGVDDEGNEKAPKRIAGDLQIASPEPETVPDPDMGYDDWGQAIYLSNDDTMSLSSAQRILYAIDNFQPLPLEHIRPHELLNYFSFQTKEVTDGSDFSVDGDLIADPKEKGIYTLGLAVRGRPVDKLSRRNAVLTLVIDRSGSMSDEGRMNYLKRGLMRMVDELKTGDMVHLVIFDHEVCVPMENFVVGRDPREKLEKVIFALEPRGSTDLNAGLSRGYEIADRAYRSDASNRVVLVTDALTNTGETDEQLISLISKYYDTRRIRLSGVGVGREFNDSLLDKLTERGKGAYVFLGSESEVDAVFGNRFISLIETTALDVHFRLHLPPSLRMNVFYGEESSTVKEDVQEIHYFANTSQLFLSDLMARGRTLRPQDDVMLTIEYKDPETESPLTEEYAFNLGTLQNRGANAQKGRMIMAWVDLLAEMAARPPQYYGRYAEGSWQDEEGWNRCEEGKQMLSTMSRDLSPDAEVTRVLQLFDKYCARYERPRHPTRRKIAAPDGSWPGAEGR